MDGRKIRERAVTALFIILFGAADRFSGGPYGQEDGRHGGKREWDAGGWP